MDVTVENIDIPSQLPEKSKMRMGQHVANQTVLGKLFGTSHLSSGAFNGKTNLILSPPRYELPNSISPP